MMPRRLPSDRFFACLWGAFHAAILLGFLLSLALRGGIRTDADLLNMMPDSSATKAMGEADRRITQSGGQNIFILVSHEDFASAKQMAERVYGQLSAYTAKFDALTLYTDESAVADVEAFIHEYRYNLLPPDIAADISSSPEGAARFAENALGMIFGGFTISSLDRLEEDPFLLDEVNMQNFLAAVQDSGTSMSPKDGVLAAKFEGRWYVMIRGLLSREGSALASKKNAVRTIYSVCGGLEEDGYRFVYSGMPFHSYAGSMSASREISLISAISMLLVIIVLVTVFRSPLPIFASVASIGVSAATAFAATHLLFGSIQLLALVFGTSLIGSCIDYSLHFFISWKANTELADGREVRAHLFKGLLLSLVSTEICYAMLFFAPFPLLKQIAVFSFTGILSAFLTVCGLYPLFRLPVNRDITLLRYYRAPSHGGRRGAVMTAAAFAAVLGTMAAFHGNLKVKNNITGLYQMQGRLKDDTVLAYRVLNYSLTGWFIVSGGTEEDVLRREEAVCARLRELNGDRADGGFIATSRLIPSVAAQRASIDAVAHLMPLAGEQLAMLEMDGGVEAALRADFARSRERYLVPGTEEARDSFPESLRAIMDMLWLGQIDGTFYSVVLPVTVTDADAYAAIAADDPNVLFENKARDVSVSLDRLTVFILLLFGIAYLVVLCVLKAFYSWAQTAKIASIPLLSVMAIAAVFAAQGRSLEFFCITGMVLVFGLGLDYIIYMMENRRSAEGGELAKLEPFAILLSFITTALSFGALALSSFVPVHVIGLSIFAGLATAFLCTLF